VIGWVVGGLVLVATDHTEGFGEGVTTSLVERIGLFTIIVLGEVVFEVVAGLSAATHDVLTVATGMAALVLGFGFWWIYFDIVGGRLPRHDGPALATWVVSHHPIALSIAASGAATVGLVEHAHDEVASAATAWALAGAVALGLLAVLTASRTLADAERLAAAYRPLRLELAAGAVAAAVVGWAHPAPWLLALLLVGILSALWILAAGRFLGADAWSNAEPDPSRPAER